MEQISPKYQMKLIKQINDELVKVFTTEEIYLYLRKWHEKDDVNSFSQYENFQFCFDYDVFLLEQTLHSMNGELLLRIAIDLGIDTPDFIPSISIFKNELKNNYSTAKQTFDYACKNVNEHPDMAIGAANSALESIIKAISNNLNIQHGKNDTLYKLTESVIDYFGMYPDKNAAFSEVKKIGSALLNINQHIEKLRSEKTQFHGKNDNDYIVDDSIYAYFIVNSVTTIGLFMIGIFEQIRATQNQTDNLSSYSIPF